MKQIFLLGAGFTKAIKPEAPLTNDFMKCLDISSFPEILEDFRDTNPDIEQFLSLIDLKYLQTKKQNESLRKRYFHIRNEVVNQIVALVGLEKLGVKREEENSLLKRFVADKIIPDHTCVLTLNYDCVMDQGLWLSKRWSPREGYLLSSFPIDDNLDLEEKEKPPKNSTLDNISLLKLHGSINFKLSDPKILDDQHKIYIEMSEELFSGLHITSNPPNGTKSEYPFVLIPSYFKSFNNDIYILKPA